MKLRVCLAMSKSMHTPSMEGEVKLGHWYAVYWQPTDYWFIGRVLGIEVDGSVSMEFVHQTAADTNNFKTTNGIDVVPVNHISMKACSPILVSSSQCSTAKLTDNDFDLVKETFLKFK